MTRQTPNRKLGSTFYDFTIPLPESWALTLSYPQAQRWKSAKTAHRHATWPRRSQQRPAHPDMVAPERLHDASKSLERCRNDAVTAPPRMVGREDGQIFTIARRPPIFGAARPHSVTLSSSTSRPRQRPSRRHASAFDRAVSHKGFPRAAPRRAVAALSEASLPSESNKSLPKRLSALEGKSTRVRRESPSKTPKNYF